MKELNKAGKMNTDDDTFVLRDANGLEIRGHGRHPWREQDWGDLPDEFFESNPYSIDSNGGVVWLNEINPDEEPEEGEDGYYLRNGLELGVDFIYGMDDSFISLENPFHFEYHEFLDQPNTLDIMRPLHFNEEYYLNICHKRFGDTWPDLNFSMVRDYHRRYSLVPPAYWDSIIIWGFGRQPIGLNCVNLYRTLRQLLLKERREWILSQVEKYHPLEIDGSLYNFRRRYPQTFREIH